MVFFYMNWTDSKKTESNCFESKSNRIERTLNRPSPIVSIQLAMYLSGVISRRLSMKSKACGIKNGKPDINPRRNLKGHQIIPSYNIFWFKYQQVILRYKVSAAWTDERLINEAVLVQNFIASSEFIYLNLIS